MSNMKPEWAEHKPEAKFQAGVRTERSDFRLERANLSPHRAYLRFERVDYKPERVDSGPQNGSFRALKSQIRAQKGPRGFWTSGNSPLCTTKHQPFAAAAQKGISSKGFYL